MSSKLMKIAIEIKLNQMILRKPIQKYDKKIDVLKTFLKKEK